jgi:ribulose-phosphate 3-epimerase
MGLVTPAVLPYSKKEFEDELTLFSQIPSVSRVQIDVVDGKFASPASWSYSPDLGEMLPNLERIEYEIDLMCFDAEIAMRPWLAFGATRFVFHAESATDLSRLLSSMQKQYGGIESAPLISFGLALNVTSDLSLIEQCINEIEFVQFMGIAAIGRQGQPFDKRVLEKVRIFKVRHPKIPVQVDGGISFESAKNLVALDVSNLVIGSSILHSNNPSKTVALFEEISSSYGI